MGSLQHVLAIPFPAQGHVIPMMELANKLVHHGFKVTFVNTDFIHNVVMNAVTTNEEEDEGTVHLVSITDGLEICDDRTDFGKLSEAMLRVMPGKLEELIEKMSKDGDKISCVFADNCMGWALEIAKRRGIKGVAFCPAPVTSLALFSTIPKLIEDGIINGEDGSILKEGFVRLSPSMPAMKTETFPWACFKDVGMVTTRKIAFNFFVITTEFLKFADKIISNSSDELEPDTFSSFPNMLPIGPLLASNRLGNQGGNFWPQDSACLSWLDQQRVCSVIYVAFGSSTMFDQTQLQELASGLELTNKPFLWVVRPDINNGTNQETYLQQFQDRVGCRGKIVSWAPQMKVLRHPSIACFVSHCGWNSTTEGLSNGVPILCRPYNADQFLNQSFICDVWKVGLGLEKDENDVTGQGEIKSKVEQLLGDKNYKARAMELKQKLDISVHQGSSYKNLNNIVEWIKNT